MFFTENNMYEIDTDEPAAKRMKIKASDCLPDRNLKFSILINDVDDLNVKKGKISRDPTSHRIIEKRRRDRMNNCLGDLSNLMPAHYSKQGQGRIEKTEVIEMAIKLIKSLQTDVEANKSEKGQDPMCLTPLGENARPCCISKFYMGFKECQDEVMRFLVENEDNHASDKVCVSMMKYLGKAAKQFLPTVMTRATDIDYVKSSSSYKSNMTCQKLSDSLSSTSADGNVSNEITEKNVQMYFNNRDMTSDSGYTNMSPTFSSTSLPWGMCQTKCLKSGSSRAHDFSSNYEKSNTSSCSGQNIYKFKHNITQRFSQERKAQQSDTSSSTSYEEQNLKKANRRTLKINNYSADKYNQTLQYISQKSSEVSQPAYKSTSSMNLTGFVLHPSGTHYFPLSIHPSNVPFSLLSDNNDSSTIFHPVSIPVRFCGPSIPMGGSNIQNLTYELTR